MRPLGENWTKVLLTVVVVGTAVLVTPWMDWDKVSDTIEQWTRRKPEAVVKQPTVLLVSRLERDRFLVRNTVEPRGYTVRAVDSVEAARGVMDQEREQIALVVVDDAIPGSQKLLRASRSQCPHARLVKLHGPREAVAVTSVLVNTVD